LPAKRSSFRYLSIRYRCRDFLTFSYTNTGIRL
jgi:hypothetical protein